MNATNYVHNGSYAAEIGAQALGALSLYHPPFNSNPYHFLEFFVRKSNADLELRVITSDKDDGDLRQLSIDTCRYTSGKPIES